MIRIGAKGEYDPMSFQVRAGRAESILSHCLAKRFEHVYWDQTTTTITASVAVSFENLRCQLIWRTDWIERERAVWLCNMKNAVTKKSGLLAVFDEPRL